VGRSNGETTRSKSELNLCQKFGPTPSRLLDPFSFSHETPSNHRRQRRRRGRAKSDDNGLLIYRASPVDHLAAVQQDD